LLVKRRSVRVDHHTGPLRRLILASPLPCQCIRFHGVELLQSGLSEDGFGSIRDGRTRMQQMLRWQKQQSAYSSVSTMRATRFRISGRKLTSHSQTPNRSAPDTSGLSTNPGGLCVPQPTFRRGRTSRLDPVCGPASRLSEGSAGPWSVAILCSEVLLPDLLPKAGKRGDFRGKRPERFQQLTDFYLRLRGFESHPLRHSVHA